MWVYQAVTNVGIQVLVLMAVGYLFARFKVLEQAKFLPQSNFIVLMLALPAFNIYLMGIKLDLQKPEPWKSLAAFLIWVSAVQGSILLYAWRFCGGDAGEAAVVNMVLLMDNYAITGLLALNATLGTRWGPLALLMAMGFFLVIFPFSLAAFEWEKWAVQQHMEATAAAAVIDIEAATAAAAAAEAAGANGDECSGSVNRGAQPAATAVPVGTEGPASGSDGAQLLAVPRSADLSPVLAASARPPYGIRQLLQGPPVAAAGGGNAGPGKYDSMELTLYGMPERGDIGPPLAAGGGGDGRGLKVTMTAAAAVPPAPDGGEGDSRPEGFPHEDRYCWWSNADYRPAHPVLAQQPQELVPAQQQVQLEKGGGWGQGQEGRGLLGGRQGQEGRGLLGGRPSSPASKRQWPLWLRRQGGQQGAQREEALPCRTYVPPRPPPDSHPSGEEGADAAEEGDAYPTGHDLNGCDGGGLGNGSVAPLMSPFQASSGAGWPPSPLHGAPPSAPPAAVTAAFRTPGRSQPPAAPSSGRRTGMAGAGGAGVLPRLGSAGPSGAVGGPASAAADRRGSFALQSVFDRLAEAGSGQLPVALFGDLTGAAGAGGMSRVGSGPQAREGRPMGMQDLKFALTHQISGGTANQLARVSRGVTAAAAAAAAASQDTNMRRLLLMATGALPYGGGGTAAPAEEAAGPSRQASTPLRTPTSAAAGTAPWPPMSSQRTCKSRLQPQPLSADVVDSAVAATAAATADRRVESPSFASGGGDGMRSQSPALSVNGLMLPPQPQPVPSLESYDSLGGGLPLPPALPSTATVPPIGAGAVAGGPDGLGPCPTFSRQAAVSAAVPYTEHSDGDDSGAAASDRRLYAVSMPMFSFGRSAHQGPVVRANGGGGEGGGTSGRVGPRSAGQSLPYRTASAGSEADKALLMLASGLALNSAKRRQASRLGDAPLRSRTRPDNELPSSDFMRLATAASALEPVSLTGGEVAALAADKALIRAATAEALRRYGGLGGAFRAFVSGHPQLWHIILTLAKNPMIWTLFIAIAVSVSGLRTFLDPTSRHYRPEVGWVAGVLSWVNGLVVPMSIFSNGAWMYGKPVLPKGEVVKMLVLLLIKVGLMPLLMAGCALLVQLDAQHVAAMTILTLSPAAATSFVLAVQYGRGVELVSLTNILGNIFLTPLLIMWLKVLTAINVNYKMHDDA